MKRIKNQKGEKVIERLLGIVWVSIDNQKETIMLERPIKTG